MSVMCVGANKISTKSKNMILLHTVEDMKVRADGSALGQSTETLFINADYCEDILGVSFDKFTCASIVNNEILIDRNRKGYPQAITIVK